MLIEPETKVVQGHFGSQTSLKAGQVVGSFTSQTKGIEQFVIDRLSRSTQ
jgi:hypothetical protein